MEFAPWVNAPDQSFAGIASPLPAELNELRWMFNGNDKSLREVFPG